MCLRPPVWWCRGQDLNWGPSFRACTPSLPRSLLVSQDEMWAASSLCTCRLLPPGILLCGCRSTASAALLKSRCSVCRGLAESGAGSGPPQRLTADSATLGPREPGLSPFFLAQVCGQLGLPLGVACASPSGTAASLVPLPSSPVLALWSTWLSDGHLWLHRGRCEVASACHGAVPV